eukprot:scaffold26625_cov40-Attheya_sp.AAC.1
MPPSNDQNTVYSDNSTMGATAKVKYTLKSVGRTLSSKDKRPSSNKNHTTMRTSTNPGKQQHGRSSETRRGSYGKTLSFSNLGQKDAYPPPVAAAAAAAAAPP